MSDSADSARPCALDIYVLPNGSLLNVALMHTVFKPYAQSISVYIAVQLDPPQCSMSELLVALCHLATDSTLYLYCKAIVPLHMYHTSNCIWLCLSQSPVLGVDRVTTHECGSQFRLPCVC